MSREDRLTVSFLLILFAVFQLIPAFAMTSINFARFPLKLVSPDGIYVFHNIVHSTKLNRNLLYVDQPDTLVLRKAKPGSRDLLTLKYHRNVDVIWAADSNSFVVNNWATNSHSDAVLYHVNDLGRPISVAGKLHSSGISAEEKKAIANMDHSYIFVEGWDGVDRLFVKASGHYFRSEKPVVSYTFYYQWTVSSNSWKLVKKENVENLERDVPNMKQFGA